MDERLAERFWSKVRRGAASDCWLWTGAGLSSRGYGLFWNRTRLVAAHRWLYEQERGSLPETVVLDHLCRQRACVNPAHLEPVSSRLNVLRGIGHSAENAQKTHCPRGHPYGGENLYVDPSGRRQCRTCRAASDKRRRAGRPPHPRDRTHCPRGHPYAGENLYVDPAGRRSCRECTRRLKRERYQVQRSKGKGLPAARTQCPRGHPYDRVTPNGRRCCSTCRRAQQRQRRERTRSRHGGSCAPAG